MDEAKNRKEEAQFRKELQQRERERMAEEKRLGEAVKGIKRSREGFTPDQAAANTQAGFTNLPTRDDEGRLVYGATETAVPRSEAEILKEEAALYSASPDIRNRTLGRQMRGEARVLETQDKIDAEDKEHANTLKAINANPDKWYQENLASFNADLTGGPNTKGYKAFPMSTANGTVLNIMGPQGQQIQQLPVTREALTRVAKAMHYDKLSTIDKKYAELAMKQEELGLKRQEGESTAAFRNRQANVLEGNLNLNRDIRTDDLGMKKPYYGALTNQANANAAYLAKKPTSKADAIKEDIDARAALLVETGEEKDPAKARLRAAREITKTAPKITWKSDAAGNQIGLDASGQVVANIGESGRPLPVGVSDSSWAKMKKDASQAGITAELKITQDGIPIIGFLGRDGNYYSTLAEAKTAKPKAK